MSLLRFSELFLELEQATQLVSLFTSTIWTCTIIIFIFCVLSELVSRQDSDEEKFSTLPKVFSLESSFSSFIKSNMKSLKNGYKEPVNIKFLGPNIHFLLSTILLPRVVHQQGIRFVRELISTEDGGLIGIDWIILPNDDHDGFRHHHPIELEEECDEKRIVMIILDQSEGGIYSHLHLVIQGMKQFAHKMFIFIPRGTRGVPLTNSILPSYSDPSDLRLVIDFVLSTASSFYSPRSWRSNQKCQRKSVTISCVSFSSGSDLLMAYLGEFGSSSHIESAICVSPLFQPAQVLQTPSSTCPPSSASHILSSANSSCFDFHTGTKGEEGSFMIPSSEIVRKVKLFSSRIFLLKHVHCLPGLTIKQILFEGHSLKLLHSEIFSKFSLTQHLRKQEERKIKNRTKSSSENSTLDESKEEKIGMMSLDQSIGKCHNLKEDEGNFSLRMNIKDGSYWDQNDPLKDVDDISVPVLFIKSRDDPLVPESVVPYGLFRSYPNLILISTSTGSHSGFISSLNSHYFTSWADEVAVEFMIAVWKFRNWEKRGNVEKMKMKCPLKRYA